MDTGNRNAIYSFGEDGVTASVSASGRLLRVSRHFEGEDFGYCVDHPSMSEPYLVTNRISELHSMTSDSGDSLEIDPEVILPDSGAEVSAEFAHDRWPRFTIEADGFKTEIQFVASGGVIYQTYKFTWPKNADQQLPRMEIPTDLLIRQLDFINGYNGFNDADTQSIDYSTEYLEDKGCIKRSHRQAGTREVALFIVACSQGGLLRFEQAQKVEAENEHGEQGTPTGEDGSQQDQQDHIDKRERYGLVWGNESSAYLQETNSLEVTFAYQLELSPKSNESSFTGKKELDKVLRRNLEHILSVCSIPVLPEDKTHNVPPAIALTCGDADDHRVATAASFYCFEFLLLALDYFQSLEHPEPPCEAQTPRCYACTMKQRILRVCKGHLRWLFSEACRNLCKNPSSPHCWVSGKEIDEWEENPWLPSKSLVEAPFQIIKVGDFFALHKDWEIPEGAGAAVKAWIKELDHRNKLGRFAFPSYSDEPTHSFYFTDHVFTWRAVKSAESLGPKSRLIVPIQPESDETDGPVRRSRKTRNYSSNQLQDQILKRFTTENPISKKRMIAVSMSPAHNRFLLRARDAGLFHAMDMGLFDKPAAKKGDDEWQNKIDIWRNLVDCQTRHDDNDDTTWDEPLRFALSFILAQSRKRMNRRSVDEMHKHSMSALLQSAWPTGLFPGELDANKEPLLYDDELMRDTYWTISFEIPYILWKYSQPASTGSKAPSTHDAKIHEATAASTSDIDLRELLRDFLEPQFGKQGSTIPNITSMQRSFPVNNAVDQKNIVELSDEWLYNEPHFFDHASVSREDSSTTLTDGGPDDTTHAPSGSENPSAVRDDDGPDIDQPAVEAFYKRHTSYGKSFFEETTAELDKWTTELHLSFYTTNKSTTIPKDMFSLQRLSEGGGPGRLAKAAMSFRFDGDFFDRYWTCHFMESDPQMEIESDVRDEVKKLLQPKEPIDEKKAPWRQRRVLELLLFDRIILRMQNGADDVLKKARHNAWKEPARGNSKAPMGSSHSSGGIDYNTFRTTSRRCQEYQQMLQTVEQDLHENLANIEQWRNRERDRGVEKPRWTFNDESRYRSVISKLLAANDRRTQELRRSHARISKFNELLTKNLEIMRADLDQRRADDIKRFTYVTVVFLPLGFATGVFSMSEAPAGRTLGSMAVTAVVAFAITALILTFAELLERGYNWLTKPFARLAGGIRDAVLAQLETWRLQARRARIRTNKRDSPLPR
ncbi:hypothetical protein ACHAPT_005309 [Fusarium lateritium]